MTRNEQIVALRKEGVGPREIARRLALTPQTVAGVLFRAGLTKPTKGRGNGAADEFKTGVVDISYATSVRRAARSCGVSPSTVMLWRKERAA